MKKIILVISILTLFSLALVPFANSLENPYETSNNSTDEVKEFNIENPIASTSDIYTLVIKILDFLIILAIPLSAILIVYAGLLYITSAGNAEKIKTAQKTLIWALIGFAIVLIAKGVPAVIEEFLSGESTTTTMTNTLPPSIQI